MSRAPSRSFNKPVELFVSYSHQNTVWLNRLRRPLLQFEHCNENAYHWDDQQMKTGDHWDKGIHEALERMDVFVCLVTLDFLTSRYVRTVELPRALERAKADEIEIVPIVIYPNTPIKRECPELLAFNPLPTWDKCWRDFEGEPGDYGDAHGPIRAGLRHAIEKAKFRKSH